MRLASRGFAAALALTGAIAGCGQQAPPDLSYILVELDAVKGEKGGVPLGAEVTVESPRLSAPDTLCLTLAPEGSGSPANFVMYRLHGVDPAPVVMLTVKPLPELAIPVGTPPGTQVACPMPLLPSSPADQHISFDFCGGESRKLQIAVGGTCVGCDPSTEVCGAGLDSDGNPCPVGTCCANAIADACALVIAPTTTSPAPQM